MPNKQIEGELGQLKEAVSYALEQAAKLGASEAEVSISKQTGISVSTRQCEVETLEFNHDGALGIALYRDKCKGSASTSDLSREAIDSAVKAALDIAEYTSADSATGVADQAMLATEIRDLKLFHPHPLEPDRFIEMASECESLALANPQIKASDGASLNSHYGVKVYGNSHGFVEGYPTSRHSLSCMLIAGETDMQRDYAYTVARDFADLESVQAIAERAVNKTISRLDAQKIATCQVPVLFDKDVSSGLLGHLVMAISGSNLYRRSSFLLDSLGEQVFPEWLQISEDPFIEKGLASTPFDSEGVRTTPLDVIKDGVLSSYLLTSYSARKLGMQSTGHAGGIHNWHVQDTGQDRAQLIKEMGTGLLVTELMGQGVNVVTGDYSRGAAGFWVENGEIVHPVHEITIAGTLQQMFKQIVAIGNDRDRNSAIDTGSILIESMKVAGN